MKLDKVLYLLQSPLQVLNSYEWRSKNQGEFPKKDIVVILETECAENNKIVFATLEELSWRPSLIIKCEMTKFGKALRWLRLQIFVMKMKYIKEVIIGAYDAALMVSTANACRGAKVVLIDDGTNSLMFPSYRYNGISSRYHLYNNRITKKYFNTELPKSITFFSIYNLDLRHPDKLEKNDLDFLRMNMNYNDKGPVFFIGSILADAGWVSYNEYYLWLKRIKEYFEGKEIHYFPHRRENVEIKQESLNSIEIKVVQPNMPFELYIARTSTSPCAVAGFYSTIFDTLKVAGLAQKNRIFSFALPPGCIKDEYEAMVSSACYAKYRHTNCLSVSDLVAK